MTRIFAIYYSCMKTVLITGVGKGIGKALAEKFLAEGWFVVGTVYGDDVPPETQQSKTFSLDLSSPDSIAVCADAIVGEGRKVDVLINNAGVIFDEGETPVVVEKLRKTLEINLIGTIDFTERLLPLFGKGGHIVNISSTAGSLERTGFPSASNFPLSQPCYKISKAALNMYTRTLALRLQDSGTAVSSVHPGWTKTDMGGEDADFTPKQAAENIYAVAVAPKDTGGFWFVDERLPW